MAASGLVASYPFHSHTPTIPRHQPIVLNGMDNYDILAKCGSGTYGSVYKAIDKRTKTLVALKKVTNVPKEDGLPVEIKYLEMLSNEKNVVHLREHFFSKGELVMVFEYMEYDLWKLMSGPQVTLSILEVKTLIFQLLQGLEQIHARGIMHRDIKPSNLLLNSHGVLKLGDFGLTTSFTSSHTAGRPGVCASCTTTVGVSGAHLSHNVVSLYYRPPELLMGCRHYGPEIDMWSVGCILVEMITHNYLFAGVDEFEQLDLIFRVFGTPNEETWPGVSSLPWWDGNASVYPPQNLSTLLSALPSECLDLASKLLTLDPKRRLTSAQALKHPWFSSAPLPSPPSRIAKSWEIGGHGIIVNKKYRMDIARSIKKIPARGRGRGRKPGTTAATTTATTKGRGRGRTAKTTKASNTVSTNEPVQKQVSNDLTNHTAQHNNINTSANTLTIHHAITSGNSSTATSINSNHTPERLVLTTSSNTLPALSALPTANTNFASYYIPPIIPPQPTAYTLFPPQSNSTLTPSEHLTCDINSYTNPYLGRSRGYDSGSPLNEYCQPIKKLKGLGHSAMNPIVVD
eukprot:TRINITY_DN7140_c0_g1_i1.p1 TRINITY_DN7140_c0_g1~~TRINITY_DN7140_c0_g1_i1.p1  ORF type:complete len:571 (+),score=75.52 TRINITY_DN7140_c0_g1_i1:820-2532(+)